MFINFSLRYSKKTSMHLLTGKKLFLARRQLQINPLICTNQKYTKLYMVLKNFCIFVKFNNPYFKHVGSHTLPKYLRIYSNKLHHLPDKNTS